MKQSQYYFMIKTLQDESVPLAFGSDFPVMLTNPLLGVHCTVTRVNYTGVTPWKNLACRLRYAITR